MNITSSNRNQTKIKLGIQGPSGSGKTYSALLLAKGMVDEWNQIVVIDTEHHAAHLYAHLGEYQVLPLEAPFTPERYMEALEFCETNGFKVIILDSISHEWNGSGGIIEIHGKMPGNSFTNWAKASPRHNSFIEKILQANCHVICTIRSKQAYVLNLVAGKYVPEKVGLKGITREGLDYELTTVFELDMEHKAKVTKDRTGLFSASNEYPLSTRTGQRIKAWCEQTQPSTELVKT
jgi:hypothetical protein